MTEVIGVRFRGGCKEYYFDPHGIKVEPKALLQYSANNEYDNEYGLYL